MFEVPARGLIGFKSLFASITRGEGLMQRAFSRYAMPARPSVLLLLLLPAKNAEADRAFEICASPRPAALHSAQPRLQQHDLQVCFCARVAVHHQACLHIQEHGFLQEHVASMVSLRLSVPSALQVWPIQGFPVGQPQGCDGVYG